MTHEDVMKMVPTFKDVVTTLSKDPAQLEVFIAYVSTRIYAHICMLLTSTNVLIAWIGCGICKARRYCKFEARHSHLHAGKSERGPPLPPDYKGGFQERARLQPHCDRCLLVSHGQVFKVSQGSDVSSVV